MNNRYKNSLIDAYERDITRMTVKNKDVYEGMVRAFNSERPSDGIALAGIIERNILGHYIPSEQEQGHSITLEDIYSKAEAEEIRARQRIEEQFREIISPILLKSSK